MRADVGVVSQVAQAGPKLHPVALRQFAIAVRPLPRMAFTRDQVVGRDDQETIASGNHEQHPQRMACPRQAVQRAAMRRKVLSEGVFMALLSDLFQIARQNPPIFQRGIGCEFFWRKHPIVGAQFVRED